MGTRWPSAAEGVARVPALPVPAQHRTARPHIPRRNLRAERLVRHACAPGPRLLSVLAESRNAARSSTALTRTATKHMPAGSSQPSGERKMLDKNRRYYDALWSDANLVEPQRFNTWPLVQSLVAACGTRLEVAPGLRPRLPIEGTRFVDISAPALSKLRAQGAQVALGQVTSL